MLKRWQEELAAPKSVVLDKTGYSWAVEGEESFPYVLQHYPTIDALYAKYQWVRDEEYKNQITLIETYIKLLSEYSDYEIKNAQLKAKLSWDTTNY